MSDLPSSFLKGSAKEEVKKSFYSSTSSELEKAEEKIEKDIKKGGDSSLTLFLSILAIVLSLINLYATFFVEKPLSPSQKQALIEISKELRALQNKEITMSAPASTNLVIDSTYPIKDIFPPTFNIPVEFSIPIDSQLVGINTITNQPFVLKVKENLSAKSIIPISSASAFGDSIIRINKTIPVEARFTSVVKVRTAYGTELNNIIDKLEKLAGASSVE
jgi:hypothetical protein